MTLTVRLGAKAERALNVLAKRRSVSRSEIVREALAQYEASAGVRQGEGPPYDAWLDVIGIVHLGVRDPTRTTGEQLTEIVRERRRARHAR